MNAAELFKTGKLQEAIAAQIQEVKANPADHARRLFLFEMLVFAGDLDRAARQIDVITYGEMERDHAVSTYRKLIDAEQVRRRLFSEGVQPHFFGDPPEQVRLRLEAVKHLRESRPAEAAKVLAEANAAAAPIRGELNGKPFSSFRDGDDLFSNVLEVMAQGEYYWVAFEQIQGIVKNPPRFPRDLVWAPARLELAEAAGDVFLPVLYPRSHEHADNDVKLGRATDWQGSEPEPVFGFGMRTFLVDDDAIDLLQLRQLQINSEAA